MARRSVSPIRSGSVLSFRICFQARAGGAHGGYPPPSHHSSPLCPAAGHVPALSRSSTTGAFVATGPPRVQQAREGEAATAAARRAEGPSLAQVWRVSTMGNPPPPQAPRSALSGGGGEPAVRGPRLPDPAHSAGIVGGCSTRLSAPRNRTCSPTEGNPKTAPSHGASEVNRRKKDPRAPLSSLLIAFCLNADCKVLGAETSIGAHCSGTRHRSQQQHSGSCRAARNPDPSHVFSGVGSSFPPTSQPEAATTHQQLTCKVSPIDYRATYF